MLAEFLTGHFGWNRNGGTFWSDVLERCRLTLFRDYQATFTFRLCQIISTGWRIIIRAGKIWIGPWWHEFVGDEAKWERETEERYLEGGVKSPLEHAIQLGIQMEARSLPMRGQGMYSCYIRLSIYNCHLQLPLGVDRTRKLKHLSSTLIVLFSMIVCTWGKIIRSAG